MTEFSKDLKGADVVRDDGLPLGVYDDLEFNPQTGAAKHILVRPDESVSTAQINFPTVDGCFQIPVSAVKAARDRVVVER